MSPPPAPPSAPHATHAALKAEHDAAVAHAAELERRVTEAAAAEAEAADSSMRRDQLTRRVTALEHQLAAAKANDALATTRIEVFYSRCPTWLA
jgi:hypothetical protein